MVGEVNGKVWGRTREVFNNGVVEVHFIQAKTGAYCSVHCHEHKFNKFCVIEGCLEIRVWKKDYALCDVTMLVSGESCTVPPGEYHQFKALAPTKALEFYWTELRSDDIVRKSVGGEKETQGDVLHERL